MANDLDKLQITAGGADDLIRTQLTDLYNYFRMDFHLDPLLLFEQFCCVLAYFQYDSPEGPEEASASFESRRSYLTPQYEKAVLRASPLLFGREIDPLDAFQNRPEFLHRLLRTADEIAAHAVKNSLPLGPPLYDFLESITLSRQSDTVSTPLQTAREIVTLLRQNQQTRLLSQVLDPACGSGAFLIAMLERIREEPGETRPHISGYEQDEHLRNCVNALIYFYQCPEVSPVSSWGGDSLIPQSEFDLVLANPPFRPQTLRVRESIFPDHTLPVRTNDAHRAFLQRTLLSLKPGGESAIIVPDSVLTHSGSDAIRVRRWIVEEFQCRAIVKLPFHTFYPQAAVNASVLFVRRPEPSEAGSRAWEKVFFFAVELDGRSNDTRRQPVDRNDFDELRKIWGDQDSLWREWCGQPHRANAHNIQVPAQWNHPHFWFAALEDIRRGDYSLLPERYRPAQLLSEPVPPPEELLDDLQTLGQEIMDLLRQLAEANYEP